MITQHTTQQRTSILLANAALEDLRQLRKADVNYDADRDYLDRKSEELAPPEIAANLSHSLRDLLQSLNLTVDDFSRRYGQDKKFLNDLLTDAELSEKILRDFSYIDKIIEQLQSGIAAALIDDIARSAEDDSGWVNTQDSRIGEAIKQATERLVFLRKIVRESNEIGAGDPPLDVLHREQLIALLEAMLAELKAPYIDRKRTGKFFAWLKKIGTSAVEKGLSQKLTSALDDAIDAGMSLTESLGSSSGVTDLTDIS